ncbi:MAG TPA: hypothetical protein VLB90_04555 [Pseudomonadales bacterium]|nr:hypothetical protein [Pseudomonadales bacterium]
MFCWKKTLLSLSAGMYFGFAQAANVAVPAPLEPWKQWVLDSHKELTCPSHYANLGERYCRWPGKLQLQADAHGAGFSQEWHLYNEGWVALPGDTDNWPQDVRVDDKSVAVIERDGLPVIHLSVGEHNVQGVIRWSELPTRLALPTDTGLLALTLQGKVVSQPSIDEQGGLLFGENNNSEPETVADSLSVQVFRELQDGIPLTMETVVRFRVAGRDRELLLGQLLLDGFVPLALETPLPARVEEDGRLRVQLRAGEWEVRLRARAGDQALTFASKKMDDNWPEEEIWSLRDNRSLRQISANGPAAIDPSQTDMPAEWRGLPAWLMRSGDALALTEIQRGDVLTGGEVSGEQLVLNRELWLDFDGSGITSRDTVRGVLKQAARFSTVPEQLLGRADVNGAAQLITRLDGQQAEAGIELRPGPLSLLSVSRLEQPSRFAVTGWQRDFNNVSARLNLPPGWMLLHAAGADSASGSWLANWNLWAIFLVLIVAAASWRLLGVAAGIIALLALLLTYHAQYAPVFFWLAALVGVALVRVLPEGKLRSVLGIYNGIVFVALVLMLLNFAVDQTRRSVYPQLELGAYADIQQRADVASYADSVTQMEPPMAAAPAAEMEAAGELAEQKMDDSEIDKGMAYNSVQRVAKARVQAARKLKTGYDTGAKVQTGPGEPAWHWRAVSLNWSGPVTQTQMLKLYLLSPNLHRLWNLVSVLLVFAFAGLLLRAAWPSTHWRSLPKVIVPAVMLFALMLIQPSPVLAQQPSTQQAVSGFPDATLLTELEQRLTRLPDCEPQCAAFSHGVLQLGANNLRMELQIDAQETVAVPLPVARNQWQPRTILVDGDTSVNLRRDAAGLLWIVLVSGSHRLLLEGPVPGDNLQLPFDMPVHNVAVEASGWQVSGLANGQIPGRSLQLTRESQVDPAVDQETSKQLLPDVAPPFLRVTRTLLLGLDWQVQTQVERLAPAVGAISVPVTLLPGEAVLTPGVEVVDGKVQVVLSAYSPSFTWNSSLKQSSNLTLAAAKPAPWVEHWLFDIAPIWHVDFSGLNPVKQDMQAGQLPRWQPWPGETLTVAISRPEAVNGNTRTIESAMLSYRPGARSSESTMSLQVRSSQGGELPLALPPASQLQRIAIDGVEQANPAEGVALSVPLRPGQQRVDVTWRQDESLNWRMVTPQPQVVESLSNIGLTLQMPEGRWLLAVGGPAMGPALLFWGVLVVILFVAVMLGRSRVAPVATWQWLLLGIGMSTVNSAGSILVVLWFVAMARRAVVDTASLSRSNLQLMQVGLVFLTVLALGTLISTIPMSLLSTPDMQVIGNQSSAAQLLWYQDRTLQGFPTAWAVSLPMWVYRAVMLLWSLWLVFSLLAWCRWGWQSFSAGEWWRGSEPGINTKTAPEQNKP